MLFAAEETQGARLSLRSLLEDHFDCNIAFVGGEEKGLPGGLKCKEGGVGEGLFFLHERFCLQGSPCLFLRFTSKNCIKGCHDGGDIGQEAVVIVHHTHEFLEGLD